MPPFNVKLTRLSSKHDSLRSTEVVGWTGELPQVGLCFEMAAPPLIEAAGNVRYVHTTPVIEMTEPVAGEEFVFKTRNSTYHLKVLVPEK